jgi:hypothetical protein
MKRILATGALLCVLSVSFVNVTGATSFKVAFSVPTKLRALILSTINSENLRVRDDYSSVEKGQPQSSFEVWDYQSPNRAESIPRRILVSNHYFGDQVEVGNIYLFHFSIPAGVGVPRFPKFIGQRFSRPRGKWTNVQSQLFAPLIDALNGNRYVLSNDTYRFSTRNGIRGSVSFDSRRIVRAEVTYSSSICQGTDIMERETETYFGIEHFILVVLPPNSSIKYGKNGDIADEKKNFCQ